MGLSALTATVAAAAVVLGGAALVASPFVVRLIRDRDRERAERIEVRQRAEIAAHLHDSVLQTLALIQRDHADPDAVLRLARAEERGLRAWLYGRPPAAGHAVGVAERLQQAAADVERSEAAVIEVVTVGDVDGRRPQAEAVVAATREAMLNAVRHSGDPQPVQVFARISAEEITVFVRDRGAGFDPGTLPDDRGGVRESIVGRITRTGGTTTLRTEPGCGDRGPDPDAPVSAAPTAPDPGADPAASGGPRVLVIDDHALVRSGVRAQLTGHVRIVGEADDVAPAIVAVVEHIPDVVLLDVHLPSGLRGGRDRWSRRPGTRHAVAGAVRVGLPRGRRQGHPGRRPRLSDEVGQRRRPGRRRPPRRRRGRRVLASTGGVRPRLVPRATPGSDGSGVEPARPDPDLDVLTTREVEVLTLIARGYTYREAAAELFVSVRTIETHVSAVLRKLQLSNRRELARWAQARNLR